MWKRRAEGERELENSAERGVKKKKETKQQGSTTQPKINTFNQSGSKRRTEGREIFFNIFFFFSFSDEVKFGRRLVCRHRSVVGETKKEREKHVMRDADRQTDTVDRKIEKKKRKRRTYVGWTRRGGGERDRRNLRAWMAVGSCQSVRRSIK